MLVLLEQTFTNEQHFGDDNSVTTTWYKLLLMGIIITPDPDTYQHILLKRTGIDYNWHTYEYQCSSTFKNALVLLL